jgi:hypothetical protein
MSFHPITRWIGVNNIIGWVGFNFHIIFWGGCRMDIKVIIFWYGWEWVRFFAISGPTPVLSFLLSWQHGLYTLSRVILLMLILVVLKITKNIEL